jgi:glucose dehydrogenase
MRRLWLSGGIVLLGGLMAGLAMHAESGPLPEWRYWGSDKAFTRYLPLDQITPANVSQLQVAWRQPGADPGLKERYPELRISGNFRSTALMIHGVLYAPNAVGLLRALDPATGQTQWEQKPFGDTIEEISRPSPRGAEYWHKDDVERLLLVRGEYLYSLDLKTGEYDKAFGNQGRVTLHWDAELAGLFSWTAGPIIVNDVIVVAGATAGAGDGGVKKEATPENIRAFDVRTGKLLWIFNVVPHAGEYGVETWGEDSYTYSGDLASWCCLTADEELDLVYVPLSAPTGIVYGGHRPGNNLFSDSLVAIHAKTGKRAWHYQMVHHDLWDYDTVGPATLGEITVDGRRIKAVMQPSKTAFLYVFDRETGKPVWPIEERPVPQSTVPREASAKTQPFPTKPPAFDRQGFTEDDLIDYTPELRARAKEKVKDFVLGPLFTPPQVPSTEAGGKRGALIMPGGWGAGNWHTGAFDPETGVYYAVSHTLPGISRAIKVEDPEGTMAYATQARGTPPGQGGQGGQGGRPQPPWPGPDLSIDGFPIFKGPYGRITAIDMNRGEQLWMVPNGDGPRNHPLVKDLNLPPLGVPGRAAPLLTKSLLFIGEGSDSIPGTNRDGMWGNKFRAYDKKTGMVLWETELPAGTTGAPITYMHGGKQYVLVTVGSSTHAPEWVAFALP